MDTMVKELAECLHAQWWANWYEGHGGHLGGGVEVCDVMPPVPAIVVAIATKLLELYPPEGDDVGDTRYAVDLGFTVTGSGGASGTTDMSKVRGHYELEQVEYFDYWPEDPPTPDWSVCLGWLGESFAAVVGGNQPVIPEAGDGTEWARDAFTPRDMGNIREVMDRRIADGKRDPDDPDYDDQEGYEDVMTSLGCVGVCCDGEVIVSGRVLMKLLTD